MSSMNRSSRIKPYNKINEIQEFYNQANKYGKKNIHASALEQFLITISLLKQESKTDEEHSFQKMLKTCFRLACYNANELGKYEQTIQIIKDNNLEDMNLFFDWGFFYCEALLHLQMYNEFEITKSQLSSLIDSNEFHVIKEILLTIEGEKYYLSKQYKEAIMCYEKAASKKIYIEGNRIFFFKYAKACFKNQDYKKALKLIDQVIECDNYYYKAYMLKIKTLLELKDYTALGKLMKNLEQFFTSQNEYIHIYFYLRYIYTLCISERHISIQELKQMYIHARKLLIYDKGNRNISIRFLNKAYIYYFNVNAFLNGYHKQDLILYPKNLYHIGKFAKIYEGTLAKYNIIIKKYDCDILLQKKDPLKLNESLDMIFKELSTLEEINSKENNFPIIAVKCAFMVNKRQFLYIVTPLYKGGTLNQILHVNKKKINIKTKLSIISQIAEAIDILHSLNIIHLNINSNNILFVNEFKNNLDKIVLAGFSKVNKTKLAEDLLNIYSAPELFNNKPHITPAADIYSFGILMCEILNESIPFQNMVTEEIIKNKREGYFPQFDKFEKDCSIKTYKNQLISLIMECLDVQFKNRIDIKNIRKMLEDLK